MIKLSNGDIFGIGKGFLPIDMQLIFCTILYSSSIRSVHPRYSCCEHGWMREPTSSTGYSAGLPMNRFVQGCGNPGLNFVTHDVSRHYGAYCRVNRGEISMQICNLISHLLIPDFFQNEETFTPLDELDRIIHALIGFNYSVTQPQKIF